MLIKIETPEEAELRKALDSRTDPEVLRIKRYLAMPDLSRTPGSPLYEIVERAKTASSLTNLDIIEIPEIVSTDIMFDLFDFPMDHPARSQSDTYYVDETHVLRPHDTVFWYYYLNHPEIKKRIENGEATGALCYGKVFRKDEIDSRHMNIFHQFGGWYIAPKGQVTVDDLKHTITEIVQKIFGPETKIRFNVDNFPYTEPSFEVEVNVKGTAAEGPAKGEWLEILGCGMPKASVLEKVGGVEGYEGWAFGFGIERLAIISMALPDIRLLWSEDPRVKSQLKLDTIYKQVSKFPPVVRDISFIVPKTFVPNDYFDLIRDVGGEMVEDVSQIDKYENEEKFGIDKMSYTYRVTYRHLERTLTNEEVNAIHQKLEERTEQEFAAQIRRV